MGKRSNGGGSIYVDKQGRWYAAISLSDGRLKERATNRLDAESRLAALRKRRDEHSAIRPSALTVGTWATDWLAGKGKLAPSTRAMYADRIRLYITPHIGSIRLARLTPNDLRHLYRRLLDANFAPKTVVGIHGIVRQFLQQAVLDGIIPLNVADRARPDISPKPRKQMVILTPEQARQLLDALRGDRYEVLFQLLLYTGMRIGEALALQWRNVDLDGRSLKIVATAAKAGREFYTSDGKTKHARRTLVLPEALVEPIKAQRRRVNEERLRLGGQWPVADPKDDFVFPNRRGGMSRHAAVTGGEETRKRQDGRRAPATTGSLHRAIKKAGLPPELTPHDLRHSFASRLVEAGVPILWVSRQLGHANISITADLYVSSTDKMMEETAAAAGKIFDAPGVVEEAQ